MNKTLTGILVLLFLGGFVYWYMNDSVGSNMNGGMEEVVVDENKAKESAISALAEKLGVSVSTITLMDAEKMDWTDGCLELGGPEESCLAAITPGLRIRLSHGGKIYVYRTDLTGNAVRFETQ